MVGCITLRVRKFVRRTYLLGHIVRPLAQVHLLRGGRCAGAIVTVHRHHRQPVLYDPRADDLIHGNAGGQRARLVCGRRQQIPDVLAVEQATAALAKETAQTLAEGARADRVVEHAQHQFGFRACGLLLEAGDARVRIALAELVVDGVQLCHRPLAVELLAVVDLPVREWYKS